MRRILLALSLALVVAFIAIAQRRAPDLEQPTVARGDAEQRILSVLRQMRDSGSVHLEVPDTDGRMLRILTEAAAARHVVEVGTSTGYSSLWLALALRGTGGRLTTFELDAGRAALARTHFQQAGVADIITVIEGDAHQTVKQVKGPVDVVFLDADKDGYVDYLKQLLPLVRPGGLVLAHNVRMAPDYVQAVTTDPALDTVFYMHGSGLGITLKKR